VHFGRFFLPTYGFLVSLGVLIGLWISVRNSERLGIDGEKAWNLGILVVLCGIVGAKVLYVINEWSTYKAHPPRFSALPRCRPGEFFPVD
jgi:phosphatidylglycerol:prolipoprotein diacylglycerol transferase